jgi:hypothetical protein
MRADWSGRETEHLRCLGGGYKIPIMRCHDPIDSVKARVSAYGFCDPRWESAVKGQIDGNERLAKSFSVHWIFEPVLWALRPDNNQCDVEVLDRLDETDA